MPDDAADDLSTGGPARAPRSLLRRLARPILLAFVLVAALALLVATPTLLPSGTNTGSLITRGATALAIGLIVIFIVRRMLRALVLPPPPAPQTVDARPSDVVYVCPVCGTRVRLEVAATVKPPKHCGEEMEARIS